MARTAQQGTPQQGMSLRPTTDIRPPTAAAPAPMPKPPTVGEAGVEDLPAERLGLIMESHQKARETAEVRVKDLRDALHSPLLRPSGRLQVRRELAKAETARLQADADYNAYNRRYTQAGKREAEAKKVADDAKAATALREQKRAALPAYRAMALENGVSPTELLALATGWMEDDKAPVKSIEQGLFRERSADARAKGQAATEKNRAALDADRDRQAKALEEQRDKANTRADASQVESARKSQEADHFRAINEVQQAFGRGDSADRAAEREFGKDTIDQDEKTKRYAANAAQRIADLRKVRGIDLQRAYHAGNLSEQQRREVEAAYGGVPPRPEAAAPAASVGAAPARDTAAAEFEALPPDQQTAENLAKIKARHGIR